MQYLLIFLIFFTACNSKKEVTSFSGTQMTIAWEIKIAEKLNRKEKARIHEAITTIFSKVDSTFNNWNPYSEISRLNQMGAHQKVTLSEELTIFLEKVHSLVIFTEGRFDPTIEPLQKLYKASFAKGILPHKKKLQTIESSVGWNNIHLEGRTFWKDHPKTALDLGGVAKGYTVDLLAETLVALGYHNFYVEWGGEIKTRGCHQNGSSWRIAIVGASVIEMGDEAIATSGDLFQRWTIDDISYTHIFDPKTKRPLEITSHSIPSVSVKGSSCAEVDAIATCLMLFPTEEEAQQWANERNLSTWIISRKFFLPKEEENEEI